MAAAVRRDAGVSDPAPAAADGFHHPASEEELVDLVKAAYREGRQLRVRGAAHSSLRRGLHRPGRDPRRTGSDVQTPPAGPNLNLMLDRYRGWRVRDEARKLVEAEAGIHLGADPSDPTGTATLETSLLWQLATEKGWSLQDTGGITHQTVSGFTATGSSGGSLQFSANRNLWGFRIVDGRGEVHEVTARRPRPRSLLRDVPEPGAARRRLDDRLRVRRGLRHRGAGGDDDGRDLPRRPLRRRRRATVPRSQRVPSRHRLLPAGVVAAARRRPGRSPGRRRGSRPSRASSRSPTPSSATIPKPSSTCSGSSSRSSATSTTSRAPRPSWRTTSTSWRRCWSCWASKDLGSVGELLGKALAAAIEFGVDAAITVLEPAARLIERELPDFFPRWSTSSSRSTPTKTAPKRASRSRSRTGAGTACRWTTRPATC